MTDTPVLDRKTLSISSKRQITIPQKYFSALGFEDKAECSIRNGELVIRPVRIVPKDDFSEQILADLVSKGLSGQELISEFKKANKQVRPAVEAMLAEAKKAAKTPSKYDSKKDIFWEE